MLAGKIIYSPHYLVKLDGHVYPTEKYSLIKDRLIREGWVEEGDFLEPELPARDLLLLVHTEEYLQDLEARRLTSRTWHSELPVNTATINSALYAVSGTVLAVEEAIRALMGIHLGGGHHHAFPDHAEGFCYLNDVAVAASYALKKGLAGKIAFLDCDVHQGNGTAFIFKKNPSVFTFSIHQEDLYPPKEKSSLDIGLIAGATDLNYLQALQKGLNRTMETFRPELVFFLAGADPYRLDKLGGFLLTQEGLNKRDQMVIEECVKRDIPCVITLAGGYAAKLEDTIELHTRTVTSGIKAMRRRMNDKTGRHSG